jgi:hypothetical protein
LEETKVSNQAKIRKYVNKNSNSNRELTSEGNGSTRNSEEIDTSSIEHEYERLPQINKKKKGLRITRKVEDENTKKYILEDDHLRTTADAGGEEVIRGLEFKNVDKVEEKGELTEFIDILKLLQKRHNIKTVEVITGELPEGKKGKRFARLSDGVTRRRYAIGKVAMMDGRECSLIEAEREGRALSMLILKSQKLMNWKAIYSILLLGVVNESGKWSNGAIKEVEALEVQVIRNKHINKELYNKVIFIYKKL